MAYDNNNSGSLFKNDRKQNERQPDYTGSAIVNGKTMRISAWVKTAKSGQKYMSLAFDEPQPAQQAPQGGYAPQPAAPAPQYQPNTQYAPRPVATPPPAPVNLDSDPSDLPFD